MKNILSNKNILFPALFFVLLIIFFSIINYGRAESDDDDNEEIDSPQTQIQPQIETTVQPSANKSTDSKAQNPFSNQGKASVQAIDSLKDSDQDGVPDKFDKHPGEDDFAYLIVDANHNGLSDELEPLKL